VTTSPRIFVAFGKAKVNDVDDVLLLADTYQEIVGLDVSM